MPLNIAQVLAAAWLVGSVIAASLGLAPLSPGRWPGIACNWFEIFMVERTVLFYVRVNDFRRLWLQPATRRVPRS